MRLNLLSDCLKPTRFTDGINSQLPLTLSLSFSLRVKSVRQTISNRIQLCVYFVLCVKASNVNVPNNERAPPPSRFSFPPRACLTIAHTVRHDGKHNGTSASFALFGDAKRAGEYTGTSQVRLIVHRPFTLSYTVHIQMQRTPCIKDT